MSLWIVDGGIGFELPVVARVEDWQEGDHIDVTGANEDHEWNPEPVRYVNEAKAPLRDPGFWTADLTWHVQLGRLPEAVEVVLPDGRGREVYSARSRRYVPQERLERLEAESAKLRELVRDMWHDGMCDCDEYRRDCSTCEYGYPNRMRELGVEVDG